MSFRQMLLGSTVARAPETDEGAEFEDDLELDPEEEEGEDDELDEDDEQDPEDGDQDDPPEQRQQQRKPNRAQDRITTLEKREKAEKDRADRLEAALLAAQHGPQKTPQQIQAERTAYLATLTPEARTEFLITESNQRTAQALQAMEFRTFDATDKSAFEALCSRNSAAAAVKEEVETQLQAMRAAGTNAPRETVLAYVIGQRALNKAPRAKTAGRKRQEDGRDRQGARSATGRGDVPPRGDRRTSERDARRKRLENVQI